MGFEEFIIHICTPTFSITSGSLPGPEGKVWYSKGSCALHNAREDLDSGKDLPNRDRDVIPAFLTGSHLHYPPAEMR